MLLALDLLDFEYRFVRHSIGHLIVAPLLMQVRYGVDCLKSSVLLAATSELFRVKEPFVDLHARKSSLFHSLALDLRAPVAVKPLEEVVEVVELFGCLLLASGSSINHRCCLALENFLLAQTLARDLDDALLGGLI